MKVGDPMDASTEVGAMFMKYSGESNLISGNNNNGIYASNLSENVQILGNKIGTNTNTRKQL